MAGSTGSTVSPGQGPFLPGNTGTPVTRAVPNPSVGSGPTSDHPGDNTIPKPVAIGGPATNPALPKPIAISGPPAAPAGPIGGVPVVDPRASVLPRPYPALPPNPGLRIGAPGVLTPPPTTQPIVANPIRPVTKRK